MQCCLQPHQLAVKGVLMLTDMGAGETATLWGFMENAHNQTMQRSSRDTPISLQPLRHTLRSFTCVQTFRS